MKRCFRCAEYLVAFVVATTGCYPAFIQTPKPSLLTAPEVPQAVRDALNKELDDCSGQLDGARRNAYDLHRDSYNAGVFGSSATLISGAAAGGLGAGSQQVPSGIVGGVSLLSGIVTLILVNKSGIAQAEEQQARLYSAWKTMASAKSEYETAVVGGANAETQKAALAHFVAAVNECGLQPPPGLLDLVASGGSYLPATTAP